MRITLLNQCFYPDVVATGQHLTDLALALSDRGHQVTVITGDRGYDDPQKRFTKKESWRGIEIIRLPSLAFGKSARWRRALGFASLIAGYVLRLIITRRQDVVVALTSPPLIVFVASLFVKIKGGRLVYWTMDLNPDAAVAAGWLREGALITRLLHYLQDFAMRRAEPVVVLDRFMHDRVAKKGISPARLQVVSLWPHDDAVAFDQHGRELFRRQHQLEDRFVVMYAGNHSPCHPLKTLLEAAERLREHREIVFCFIGGGSEFAAVRQFADSRALPNILCLPYLPRDTIAASLSAADLHVVVMGQQFVGIIHPCKIYNVLKVGAPFLYIGPPESHVIDIIHQGNGELIAYVAEHGAIDQVTQSILNARHERSARQTPSTKSLSSAGLMKLVEILEARRQVSVEDDPIASATSPAPATAGR
jgi:glycosyltransferase involved in cell wall biosynthesis